MKIKNSIKIKVCNKKHQRDEQRRKKYKYYNETRGKK